MPKKQKPRTRVNCPIKVGSPSQSSSKKMMLCPMSGMKETAKMSIFLSQSERISLLAAEVATG